MCESINCNQNFPVGINNTRNDQKEGISVEGQLPVCQNRYGGVPK